MRLTCGGNQCWILLLFSLISFSTCVEMEGLFTAFASKKIFNNSVYNIWISGDATGNNSPPPLKLSINCSLTKSDVTTRHEFVISEHPNWKRNQNIHATFHTDKLFAESYESCTLIAAQLNTSKVLDQFPVTLIDKSKAADDEVSIFIQMDKPAYKPGEEVHMRFVTLNERKLPTSSTPLKITVKDAKNITIHVVSEFKENKKSGIRTFQFKLAKQLNLGPWTMTAESGGVKETRTFLTEKYVLPKFFVKVHPTPNPNYMTIGGSPTFIVEVQAAYTYGKSLEGNCSIILYAEGNKPIENQGAIPQLGDLSNGMTFFTFPTPTAIGKYYLEANVSESKTGRWVIGTHSFQVYQIEPFHITWLNPVDTFKLGSRLDIKLAVSTVDHLPVTDAKESALEIKSTRRSGSEDIVEIQNLPIPPNGMVTFTINTPSSQRTTFHSIVVSYKYAVLSIPVPRAFQSTSKLHLAISQPSKENYFHRKSNYTFRIDASEKTLKRINYILYDGVNIIDFKTNRRISDVPVKSGDLEVFLPRGVYTELKIFVFFIHHFTDSGGIPAQELVSASTTWETSNYIDLELSAEKVEPAENISLTFRTHPGSTIAIRGVDQSVLLLSCDKSNLDLDPATVPYNPFWKALNPKKSSSDSSSLSDFINDFKSAGLDILTNLAVSSNTDIPQIRNRRVSRQAEYDVERPEWFAYNFHDGAVRTRTEFPEVWLWEEIDAKNETTVFRPKVPKVPDTITSWYITAMSVNKDSGLAVTPFPKIINVFRPFFITFDLPYSVIKHETFVFRVLVHNYLDADIWTEITFFNNDNDFQFVDTVERVQQNVTRRIRILSQTVDVVQFVVTPLKLGLLPMHVGAVTKQAGDAVIRPLNVIAPGVISSKNDVKKIIQLGKRNDIGVFEYTEQIQTRKKRSLVSRSLKFTGDTLAPILDLTESSKVKNLIKLPNGCCEQTMLDFYPHVVALDYLRSLNKLTREQRSVGADHLQKGYQKVLRFYDESNGYFKYHPIDGRKSTWVTAYILRCLAGARMYTTIDEQVLIKGSKYLAKQQNEITGEFVEYGKNLYPDYFVTAHYGEKLVGGGARKNVNQNIFRYAITAYVTLALAEIFSELKKLPMDTFSNIDRRLIEEAMVKGLKFISSDDSFTEGDAYSIAIVTATLHATNHAAKDRFYLKLETFAKFTDEGNMKHYEINSKVSEPVTTALSIEITAYALLTHIWRSQISIGESISIVKWLFSKRNEDGGFISSQDTVVALTALSKYAQYSLIQPNEFVDIEITTNNNDKYNLKVNPNNSIALQELVFPSNTQYINMTFRGRGRCCLEYKEHHNERNPRNAEDSQFKIKAQWKPITESSDEGFNLELCVHSVEEEETGDAVAEVNLPTGYVFEEEEIQFLLDGDAEIKPTAIKNIEIEMQGTKVVVYYDFLNQTPVCVNIRVARTFNVASKNKAGISVYEYMDPKKNGTMLINAAVKKTVCEICLETKKCDILKDCSQRL